MERALAKSAALRQAPRMILPAFDALTGGMDAADPAILSALQPAHACEALTVARGRLVQYPLWQMRD